MCPQRNIILNSVRQHNHFITQGNYKATCFDYNLVIFRPILTVVLADAMMLYTFWDPKVCIASGNTNVNIGLKVTRL